MMYQVERLLRGFHPCRRVVFPGIWTETENFRWQLKVNPPVVILWVGLSVDTLDITDNLIFNQLSVPVRLLNPSVQKSDNGQRQILGTMRRDLRL